MQDSFLNTLLAFFLGHFLLPRTSLLFFTLPVPVGHRPKKCQKLQGMGIEPTTSAVLKPRHNQLDHPCYGVKKCVYFTMSPMIQPSVDGWSWYRIIRKIISSCCCSSSLVTFNVNFFEGLGGSAPPKRKVQSCQTLLLHTSYVVCTIHTGTVHRYMQYMYMQVLYIHGHPSDK